MSGGLRGRLPPTLIGVLRWVRTAATLAGVRDPEERTARAATTAAMAAQPRPEAKGPRVLIFSLRGSWYPHTAWETVVAHAMRARGADVHVFNCGGRMPICEVNFRGAQAWVACAECRLYPDRLIDAVALPRSWLRDYLSSEESAAIERAVAALLPERLHDWSFDDRPIGKLVRNSVLWFLRKSGVTDDPADLAVYRKFLVSGAQIARMAPRLLAAVRPDLVIELNGLFFAEQIVNTFVPASTRVATYEAGWRTDSLGFDWLSPAGFADLDEPWTHFASQPLTPVETVTLDDWIRRRRGGDMQRDFYVHFDAAAKTSPFTALGLDPSRPTAVLFTNLVWDTAVFGRDIGFASIADWLQASIGWFAEHRDHQLVIRIHPAEDLRPSQESKEKLGDLVRGMTLPPNVVMVPSAASLSSYSLMEAASVVLVYTSTAGLEAALYGKPVLTAARVYYAGRGFTSDIPDARTFAERLTEAFRRGRLEPAQVERARRFAYLLLFRFLHAIPVVKQRPRTLPLLAADETARLLPGADADFDHLLRGLLTAAPLVSDVRG